MKSSFHEFDMPNQPPPELPVNVVFAYEEDFAFHAAMKIFRGVAGRLAAQFEFHDFSWRFGALTKPAVFERAAGIAAGADVVFCCPSNPHVLPRLVQDWIRQWLTRRTLPDGALALLLPATARKFASPTLLERDLRETARAGGLAFFVTSYLVNHSPHAAASPAQLPAVLREDKDAVLRPPTRVIKPCGV